MLLPERFYSWQTAMALCVLAWLMSFPTVPPIQNLLVRLGWIFLIIGVGWMTTANPIQLWGLSFSPWITGILVCLFLFVSSPDQGIPRIAVISWPVIAALVAIFPASFRPDTGFQVPPIATRTRLLVLVLVNLLLTAWILFFYTLADWLVAYPGLRQENFAASTFIYPVGTVSAADDRGQQIVAQMIQELQLQVDGRTRSEVEQWLLRLQDDPAAPNQFREAVFQQLALTTPRSVKDAKFWQFELRIADPEYQVLLGTRWMGPSAMATGYLMQRTCRISFPTALPTAIADVTCVGPVNKIVESPSR